jgi:hypothetical protein
VLAAAVLLAACGGESGEEKPPVRLLRPGVLLTGPAGGSERVGFTDGSSVNFVVTGRMAVTLPKGVFLDAAFPATVTFSVLSSNGETLAGKSTFERVQMNATRHFTGEMTSPQGSATFTGAFLSVSGATHARVDSYSFAFSDGARSVYLQSDLLSESTLSPQP